MSTTSLSPAPIKPTPKATRTPSKPGPKPRQKSLPTKLSFKTPLGRQNFSQYVSTLPPASTPPDALSTPRVTPSDANGSETPTVQPLHTAPTPTAGTKRRGGPGGVSKAGGAPKRVRTSGVGVGRKGRLDPSATPGSKLGPKSNMGAINDRLRGLDRSGRPCKRWMKTGITLKSFTGVAWTIQTWGRPATGVNNVGNYGHGLHVVSQQQGMGSASASAEPEGRTPDIMVQDTTMGDSVTVGIVPPGIVV